MRNIADKLRAHLVAPMDSESAVVYLMAALRILVEKTRKRTNCQHFGSTAIGRYTPTYMEKER
jgi:hypothetical protein